jgi:hypothetical protein
VAGEDGLGQSLFDDQRVLDVFGDHGQQRLKQSRQWKNVMAGTAYQKFEC